MNVSVQRRVIAHAMITALLLHLSNTPWFYPVAGVVLALAGGTSYMRAARQEFGGVHAIMVHTTSKLDARNLVHLHRPHLLRSA